MRALDDPPENFPPPNSSTIKVAIIYEDFASGARAKNFAERLAEQLNCACPLCESLWRSELLESPRFAAEAARTVADCDYLIVSLNGDRILPVATRQWIETRIEAVSQHTAGLIVLSDLRPRKGRVFDDTRHLRSVCAAHGLAFFSHAATPSVSPATSSRAREEAMEPLPGESLRMPRQFRPDHSMS